MFSKSLKKLAKIALLVAVIVVIGYLIYAFIAGVFPFRGAVLGENEGEAPTYIAIEEEPDIDDEPDIDEEPDITIDPPSLVIEISEDRIIFDGEVISLEDLEEVLRRYASDEDIWELHDVYRADRATYESVRELLRTHDVAYRQR